MSYYTFVFKKDDLEIQLTSTDKSEIEKQMKIWFNCVSVYTRSKGNKENNEKAVKEVPLKQEPEVKPFVPMPEIKPVLPKAEVKSEILEEIKKEQAGDFKTEVSEIQQEKPKEEVRQEGAVKEEPTEQSVEEVKPKSGDEVTINNMNIPKPQKSFTELLEQQMENNTYEPKFRRDEQFINFVNRVNLENTEIRFGLLLKAAYYLTRYENYDRVTLKDINAKLMQNFSIIADHSVVEQAISKALLEIVPDLTGMADAAEYRLTEAAERIFA